MLTGCPWEEDTDVTPPHWRKISMQEVYASLNKVHGEGKIKQNCISAVPPPAPLWGITQSLDNYLLLEIVAPFSCPWNPLPGNWNFRHTGSSVLCWFVYRKSRQVFCVCCSQFPTPRRGSGLLGTQLDILQALPPSGKSCLLRDLTTGTLHHGKEESSLGAWPTSLKCQQELKNNQTQTQTQNSWSREAGSRD